MEELDKKPISRRGALEELKKWGARGIAYGAIAAIANLRGKAEEDSDSEQKERDKPSPPSNEVRDEVSLENPLHPESGKDDDKKTLENPLN